MLYIYCVKEIGPSSSDTGNGQGRLVLNQKDCIKVVQILMGKEEQDFLLSTNPIRDGDRCGPNGRLFIARESPLEITKIGIEDFFLRKSRFTGGRTGKYGRMTFTRQELMDIWGWGGYDIQHTNISGINVPHQFIRDFYFDKSLSSFTGTSILENEYLISFLRQFIDLLNSSKTEKPMRLFRGLTVTNSEFSKLKKTMRHNITAPTSFMQDVRYNGMICAFSEAFSDLTSLKRHSIILDLYLPKSATLLPIESPLYYPGIIGRKKMKVNEHESVLAPNSVLKIESFEHVTNKGLTPLYFDTTIFKCQLISQDLISVPDINEIVDKMHIEFSPIGKKIKFQPIKAESFPPAEFDITKQIKRLLINLTVDPVTYDEFDYLFRKLPANINVNNIIRMNFLHPAFQNETKFQRIFARRTKKQIADEFNKLGLPLSDDLFYMIKNRNKFKTRKDTICYLILNRENDAILDEPFLTSFLSESTRPKQFELPAMTELNLIIPQLVYESIDIVVETNVFGEKPKSFTNDRGKKIDSSSLLMSEVQIRLFIPKATLLIPTNYADRQFRSLTPMKCVSVGKKKDKYTCQQIPALSKMMMQKRRLFIN